jgi:hypothetical protein
MKHLAHILLVALPLLAQAADLKPGVMTNPLDYAAAFPLDKLTEIDMLEQVGPPDRVVELGGKKVLVYQFGQGFGLRTWSYIVEGGKVVEVSYSDKGSYDGTSARKAQNKQ